MTKSDIERAQNFLREVGVKLHARRDEPTFECPLCLDTGFRIELKGKNRVAYSRRCTCLVEKIKQHKRGRRGRVAPPPSSALPE